MVIRHFYLVEAATQRKFAMHKSQLFADRTALGLPIHGNICAKPSEAGFLAR